MDKINVRQSETSGLGDFPISTPSRDSTVSIANGRMRASGSWYLATSLFGGERPRVRSLSQVASTFAFGVPIRTAIAILHSGDPVIVMLCSAT